MSSSGSETARQLPGAGVPVAAAWLAGLGVVPFVALSAASKLTSGDLKRAAIGGLMAYAAVILSFLGGIHWGAAMADPEPGADHTIDAGRLCMSVVPSLAGWLALLLEATHGLVLLAFAFAATLLLDLRFAWKGQTPPWYPRLRKPLTMIVVSALLVARFGN